ncbi:hypothetical protein U1Q18_010165 [Sarracenia purpurea var. burkii]
MKEKAMTALSPYRIAGSHDYMHDGSMHSQQATETAPQPFVSLLEFVSEIYQIMSKPLNALKHGSNELPDWNKFVQT